MIIHRTSSDREKKTGKPKGLWCGQEVMPHTEAQAHTDSFVNCPGCKEKIEIEKAKN